MERFDVGVVFRRGHVGELLIDALVFQISPDHLGDELRAVVIADGHTLGPVFQQHQRQHHQDISFADMTSKLVDQHLSAVDVDHRQQEHISARSVDVHVFDIHRQVLQRSFRLQTPEPDKIPFKGQGPDPGTVEQSGFFHQPVHLFVVDDPPQLPEFGGHVLIAIATELLPQDHFHLDDDDPILHLLAMNGKAMGAGLYTFAATRALIVKTAGRQFSPF